MSSVIHYESRCEQLFLRDLGENNSILTITLIHYSLIPLISLKLTTNLMTLLT